MPADSSETGNRTRRRLDVPGSLLGPRRARVQTALVLPASSAAPVGMTVHEVKRLCRQHAAELASAGLAARRRDSRRASRHDDADIFQ